MKIAAMKMDVVGRRSTRRNNKDMSVTMCGPPAMIEYGCVPGLEKMGYTEEDLIEF